MTNLPKLLTINKEETICFVSTEKELNLQISLRQNVPSNSCEEFRSFVLLNLCPPHRCTRGQNPGRYLKKKIRVGDSRCCENSEGNPKFLRFIAFL